jgi:hypothetical protein
VIRIIFLMVALLTGGSFGREGLLSVIACSPVF